MSMDNWFQSDSCAGGGEIVGDLLELVCWLIYIPILLAIGLYIGLTFTEEEQEKG